jgi:hypothetical protein
LGIETVSEELICFGAGTFTDGAGGAEEGPASYGDAEGDERLFSEPTGEFLQSILFVEVSGV